MAYLTKFILIIFATGIHIFASQLDSSSTEPRDELDRTQLHRAAQGKGQETLEKLIIGGSQLNARDGFNYTPLILASISRNTEAAIVLLTHGADANCQDRYGRTALYYALSTHNTDLINLILSIPDLAMTIVDRYGLTPMHWGAYYGDFGIVRLLCEKGADQDLTTQDQTQRFRNNSTPLMFGAQGGNPEVVEFLLELLRDTLGDEKTKDHIDLLDKEGRSALQWAVYEKKPEVAEILLKFGATPKINPNTLYVPPSMKKFVETYLNETDKRYKKT